MIWYDLCQQVHVKGHQAHTVGGWPKPKQMTICQKQFFESACLHERALGPSSARPSAFEMFLTGAVGVTLQLSSRRPGPLPVSRGSLRCLSASRGWGGGGSVFIELSLLPVNSCCPDAGVYARAVPSAFRWAFSSGLLAVLTSPFHPSPVLSPHPNGFTPFCG